MRIFPFCQIRVKWQMPRYFHRILLKRFVKKLTCFRDCIRLLALPERGVVFLNDVGLKNSRQKYYEL